MQSISSFLLFFLLANQLVAASPVTKFPYFLSFEESDSLEVDQWNVLIPTTIFGDPIVATKWYTGSILAHSGEQSAYVSADNGINPSFENGAYSIGFYRTFNLPAGEYNVEFYWEALGGIADTLFVCWIPDLGTPPNISGNGLGARPSAVKDYMLPGGALRGKYLWQKYTTSVNVPADASYHLAFVWKVGSVNIIDALAGMPGACIDDVQIYKKTNADACDAKPYGLKYRTVDNAGIMSWQGNATSYDLDVFRIDNTTVTSYTNITQNSYTFPEMLEEGAYSFRVRAVCETSKSAWADISEQLVYDPSEYCVDYLNLTDTSKVRAHYGSWNATDPNPTVLLEGIVDSGYASYRSRHTVHYMPYEYDAYTKYQLKTVPQNRVGSVRLGTWVQTSPLIQDLVYTFDIEEYNQVIRVDYAVVAQSGGHGPSEQPRIDIVLLDENNDTIDAKCGVARFNPPSSINQPIGYKENGWEYVGDSVYFRDWTSVGFNLEEYVGRKVKLRVISRGCPHQIHPGYMYFALDCGPGGLVNQTCGEKPDTLTVVDGFDYRWYKPFNPTEPFYEGQDPTLRSLPIAVNDTNTYYCDLTFRGNSECFFTIKASALKRIPKARAEMYHTPNNCTNLVSLLNKSGVFNYLPLEDGTEEEQNTGISCDYFQWSVKDINGNDSIFSYDEHPEPIIVPAEGKELQVKLLVKMPNMDCFATDSFTISVPSIVNQDSLMYICAPRGESIIFDGREYLSPVVDTIRYTSQAGCDSLLILVVDEEFTVQITDSLPVFCADAEQVVLSYNVLSGTATETTTTIRWQNDSVQLVQSAEQNEVRVDMNLLDGPNRYDATIVFGTSGTGCGSAIIKIPIEVRYLSSLIEQRWDDVLGVLNENYNGGYVFTDYQWYKNGVAIENQNKPYMHIAENKLDTAASYSVLLTRTDGVALLTCAYQPTVVALPEQQEIEVTVTYGANRAQAYVTNTRAASKVVVWNLLGLQLYGVNLPAEGGVVDLPTEKGTYVITIHSEDGLKKAERVLVK